MARRVHGERAVGLPLLGSGALLIGAPRTAHLYGDDAEHQRPATGRSSGWCGRRKAQETIFLGTKAEADRILARVHNQHLRVKGELGEDAGAAHARRDPPTRPSTRS